MENIGYHTRLFSDDTRKIVGGSFRGSVDTETLEKLVKSHFTVIVKNSGRAVFVDREGREVALYISVDASKTLSGIEALRASRVERAKLEEERRQKAREEEEEVNRLMEYLTHEEIVKRLTRK